MGMLVVLSSAFLSDVHAHGESDWNDFKIDNKGDSVATTLQHVRTVISDVILGRRAVSRWPDQELLRARDELLHLNEELDGLLDYLKEDGTQLQFSKALRENPRAGRSVAASHAVEACIDLLEHINSLDGPAAFEMELETDGIGVYMFDLMDAYTDQMDLYADLINTE
jgi:hypothetical protein